MVCYWAHIISGKQSKLSFLLYRFMLTDNVTHKMNYNWLTSIKHILDHLGMSNVWISPKKILLNWLSQQIKIRQNYQYLQIWNNNISMLSRGKKYQLFKEQLIFEKYLNIIPKMFWRLIINFRTSNQ